MASGLTGRNRKRGGFPVLILFSVVCLLLAVALSVRELIAFSQDDERLPSDLTIAGVDVGGMLLPEARIVLEQAYAQPITLYYDNSPIVLDPASVGFRLNWPTMLAEAVSLSDAEGSFWLRFLNHLTRREVETPTNLPIIADYQQSLLRQLLEDISRRYDRPSGRPSYDVQTLTTFSGDTGFALDIEQAAAMIDMALNNPNERTVRLPIGGTDSDRPGLQTLRSLIIEYLDSQGFIYDGQTTIASVFIMDLKTGEEINILSDVAFTAASTTKASILIDYYRRLSTQPTQEEAWLMANSLLCSRNASSNLLLQIIGGGQEDDVFNGLARVTETMQYLGARNTFMTAPFVEGTAGQLLGSIAAPQTSPNPNFSTNPDPYNQTTAEDMGTLFTLLYDCDRYGSGLITAFPNGEISRRDCHQMLELMSANDLLRLLQAGIPPDVRISHKNGWLADMVGDAGVVYPPNGRDYVISVFLWEEAEFQDFERLWPLLEGISRAAWNYFSPEDPLLGPREVPFTAQDCEGNYLPPNAAAVDLDNIRAWQTANQ
jgi:beta-lactamase class A